MRGVNIQAKKKIEMEKIERPRDERGEIEKLP